MSYVSGAPCTLALLCQWCKRNFSGKQVGQGDFMRVTFGFRAWCAVKCGHEPHPLTNAPGQVSVRRRFTSRNAWPRVDVTEPTRPKKLSKLSKCQGLGFLFVIFLPPLDFYETRFLRGWMRLGKTEK
jgi:hypothetical protein